MNRRKVIAVAVVLAVLGTALPMAAMFYFSWMRTVHQEQKRLELFAQHVIMRANHSLKQATEALQVADTFSTTPCSKEHILEMRRLAVNVRSVEEVGYFEDGLLKCTSWGTVEGTIRQVPVDFTTQDGVQITIRMKPKVSMSNPMMAMHYKSHNVLVDPVRLVDIVADPAVQLAIANDRGALLATLHDPDPALAATAVAKPGNSIATNHLIASTREGHWIAVAITPRTVLLGKLRNEQMWMLPLGLLIAAGVVGLVVWFSRRRLSPLGELAIAVQNREFIVHYQPIVELKSGRCVGAEALVRWRRPDGTLVRPDLFIPLAEESGLIMPITDQVVESVIRDLNALLVADRSLHIAINLSALDIKSARILPVIGRMLENTGIEPQQISLETTERGFMDVDSARTMLAKARELGHAVAIDDFGTGYSSLSNLQSLPLDTLKIDKSFIDTIGMDSATSSVTPHIIGMAQSLNLKIVAEGVETQVQADYLLRRDVDYAQGWLFSKPLPAFDFIAYYRRGKNQQERPALTSIQRVA